MQEFKPAGQAVSELDAWLMQVVNTIQGEVPEDKVNLIKRMFRDECLYKLEDINEIADCLTKDSLKLKGVPIGFAKAIDIAVHQLKLDFKKN